MEALGGRRIIGTRQASEEGREGDPRPHGDAPRGHGGRTAGNRHDRRSGSRGGYEMGAKAVIILALLLVGCTTTTPVADPRKVWCEQSEPRRDATMETPRAELDEINSHNRKGMLWCGRSEA